MGIELSRMIAEVVAAAGRGAESLRQTGTPVVLEECSIEIVLGDEPAPSAHVRVSFGQQAEAGQVP